jgi:putative transposase
MVGQLVSFSIRGQIVARYLSGLIETRGKPERILCDNGTEFAIKAMFFLSKLSFIQPGKPKTPLWRV